MSRRSPPGGSTRTRTTSSTGSSKRVSRGGSCCRSTSPTSSAPPTRRGRPSPGSSACCSLPGSKHYDSGEGDEGAPQGDWLEEWVAVRRRVGASRPDALPARVAGAEVVRQRARDPADRRHPALRRRRLVRRDQPSVAVRPLGRRGRLTVPESSRGTALGHAGVRLAGARAHGVRLVAGPARARARAVRPAAHRPLPRPREVLGAPARRDGSDARLLGRGPGDRVLRRRPQAAPRPAVDRRGSRPHHARRDRAARGRSACRG